MSKQCWWCKGQIQIPDDIYGDIKCPYCNVMNSFYKPGETIIYGEETQEGGEEMKIKLSDFIKADIDVKQGDIITLLDEGIEQESETFTNEDGSPKIDHIFKISLSDGEERKISMNKTSLRKFVEKFGNESAAWVGKKAVVSVVMNPNGKKGIVLDPQ